MPTYSLRTEVPHPLGRVFAWHTRPGALERLLPPWETARVVAKSGGMEVGGRVTVEVKKGPVPVRMEVEHTAFEEGQLFRDEQVSGPFSSWVHTHRFEALFDGGTAVLDEVEWQAPLGSAGKLFGGHAIEDELDRGFRWRHERLRDDLARHGTYADAPPLTVVVTGSGGLIGRSLCRFLTTGGHRVVRLIRSRKDAEDARAAGLRHGLPGTETAFWDPDEGEIDWQALDEADAVVHLAGEPLQGIRWTVEKKRAIRESRLNGTELLASTLAGLSRRPRVLVSSSAVGFYGDRGDHIVTEDTGPGRGFLANVCKEWEAAADPARRAGIRTVLLRTGMVLSPAGGALGTMLLPFKMGVGGRLGSGRQYVAWIDHDDLVGAIHHCLMDESLEGPVNGTSPHPVPNSTFTSTMGRVLHRPTVLPVPSLAVKAAFGEMGSELLLKGARAVPRKLEDSGFPFFRPGLEESLRFQLGRPEASG